MSITSISGAASSLLSQITNSQQTQAVSADEPDADTDMEGTQAGASAAGNSLTGTMGASLDSQTLQALLNLTQQDPAQDASGTTAQGTQTGQAQHHHHHHHGTGQPGQAGSAQGGDPTALASTDPTALDPLDGDDSGQDGLTALLSA